MRLMTSKGERPLPSAVDYRNAMLDWPRTASPEIAQKFPIALDETFRPIVQSHESPTSGSLPLLWRDCGNDAIVFLVSRSAKKTGRQILRCLVRGNIENYVRRYRAVSIQLSEARKRREIWSASFVETSLVPEGLHLRDGWWPVLLMDQAEGQSMDEYIRRTDGLSSERRQRVLGELGDAWDDLIDSLWSAKIAHGDLCFENVFVSDSGRLTLIDYDSLYLPSYRNLDHGIRGHADFQHPSRMAGVISDPDAMQKVDCFSALVLYLIIRVEERLPGFWANVRPRPTRGELYRGFVQQDFEVERIRSRESAILRLTESHDKILAGLARRLVDWCSVNELPTTPLRQLCLELGLRPRGYAWGTSLASSSGTSPVARSAKPTLTEAARPHPPSPTAAEVTNDLGSRKTANLSKFGRGPTRQTWPRSVPIAGGEPTWGSTLGTQPTTPARSSGAASVKKGAPKAPITLPPPTPSEGSSVWIPLPSGSPPVLERTRRFGGRTVREAPTESSGDRSGWDLPNQSKGGGWALLFGKSKSRKPRTPSSNQSDEDWEPLRKK